ncbi:MAG: oxidoreductase of aldo/keto reductase family, subgroup 1 [uncultured Solirubrobacteraceae bacterium]|uniref:Oxidoreductase of aldo/keto reductase family, subgroup 1 n=1 Tax=uncultured Solirubrobacteraceae bacterium TaxID=1162706 RepID=A0A6J4TQ52_9ACTN|nr:MAG: oxidoreductase of aldo/keto reductase family, subgroup 1 [uncultured Solirubrobacteraceae bacterium]
MTDTTVSIQGSDVPALGFGTWQLKGKDCSEGVATALQAGYRHIDTARIYENEAEVGEGLRAGGVAREEIWVTSKVWTSDFTRDRVRRATEKSLEALGIEQLDLYLMHWHNPDVPLEETLTALREVQEEGLVRHIGVSNFTVALVDEARRHATIFANQVEYHPYLGQAKLVAQAQEHDILLEAYSPFAHGLLHDDEVLTEIGRAHGKSAGQVALRWLLDHPNVCALPKATAPERIRQNLEVFDFELSDEERRRIDGLERGKRTADPAWAPDWDEPSAA